MKVHMLQSRRKTLISMTYFLYIFYELTIVIKNMKCEIELMKGFIRELRFLDLELQSY